MDSDKPYKEGTIKLTWINPNNYWVLESKMFDSIDSAIRYGVENNKKDWLIFKLNTTDGNQYKWDLLPYGAYRSYTRGMKISDSMPIKIAGATLMVFGLAYIFKLLSKSK